MSALHTADISRRLNDFLGRRQPPRSFAADDQRKVDQIAAYVGILKRFAPQGDALDDWWGGFLEALSEASDTWAWPSEGEFSKACKATAKQQSSAGPQWQIDQVAVAVRRIENDEPIGESWLWGFSALLLIDRVGLGRVQERRDRFAGHLAQVYDIEPARQMILDLEARHAAAERARSEAQHAMPRETVRMKIKNVRDLVGPGPQYVPLSASA